jgi:hypothetical protein
VIAGSTFAPMTISKSADEAVDALGEGADDVAADADAVGAGVTDAVSASTDGDVRNDVATKTPVATTTSPTMLTDAVRILAFMLGSPSCVDLDMGWTTEPANSYKTAPS